MGKPMTKAKIVTALAETTDVPKKTSAAYLEALASLAHKEAKNGFTIPGIGKLVVRSYKARVGRNPQTGKEIEISARRVLTFRPSQVLKTALNAGFGNGEGVDRDELEGSPGAEGADDEDNDDLEDDEDGDDAED